MLIKVSYDGQNPPQAIRLRLNELCNPEFYPIYDASKFKAVFFPEFEHDLKVISEPPNKTRHFNCYAYVLGLSKHVHRNVIIEAIKNGYLMPKTDPSVGDIVIYRDSAVDKTKYSSIQHAGLLSSETKIVSKWAASALFEHDIFFVPLYYGNNIEFYSPLNKKGAEELFEKYQRFNYQ